MYIRIVYLVMVMWQKMLGVSLMRERLDMDTLELVRLVPSKVNFNQKYVKTKTKLLWAAYLHTHWLHLCMFMYNTTVLVKVLPCLCNRWAWHGQGLSPHPFFFFFLTKGLAKLYPGENCENVVSRHGLAAPRNPLPIRTDFSWFVGKVSWMCNSQDHTLDNWPYHGNNTNGRSSMVNLLTIARPWVA